MVEGRSGQSLFDTQGKRLYLNELERRKFRDAISKQKCPSKQAFCLTIFYSGCRPSEITNLRKEHIDFTQKTIVIRTLKQRGACRMRFLSLPPKLLSRLKKLTQSLKPEDLVWNFSRSTAWRIVKKSMAEAKIEGPQATSKGLRHSFATSHSCLGVPLPKVQRWMGHENFNNTAIYIDVVGDEERKLASRIWLKEDL
ncbi:site-specific integrase [Roseibacillus persicicus]|uniref:tyrosine-type recombinase/integrase n=1 Tax=Roseibacillus persicicus TaxID=454148 RepID=UPI00398B4B49